MSLVLFLSNMSLSYSTTMSHLCFVFFFSFFLFFFSFLPFVCHLFDCVSSVSFPPSFFSLYSSSPTSLLLLFHHSLSFSSSLVSHPGGRSRRIAFYMHHTHTHLYTVLKIPTFCTHVSTHKQKGHEPAILHRATCAQNTHTNLPSLVLLQFLCLILSLTDSLSVLLLYSPGGLSGRHCKLVIPHRQRPNMSVTFKILNEMFK